jgi:hypothetical protein
MLIGRASFQCIVASRNELWSTHKKRSLEAIQVDGGSEFKAEFEAACQAKAIRGY